VIMCNAGIGGWTGLSWLGLIYQLFTEGPVGAFGAPKYKVCRVGAQAGRQLVQIENVDKAGASGEQIHVVDAKTGQDLDEEPLLAEVFCANVFGHYVLVHELLPLLERKPGQERGRVIWISTVEAYAEHFDISDIQGFKSKNAYESSKRLTDVLILSSATGDGNQWAKRYLGDDGVVQQQQRKTRSAKQAAAQKNDRVPPKMYLCHPGICITDILPISAILVMGQVMMFYLCRWFGSQWHNVTKEKGVTAQVWLILEDEKVLESNKVAEKKWGSGVNPWGEEKVVETNVEDLGTSKFADQGAKFWEEIEELREDWDGRVRKWEAEQ
jgi:3-keto steroid reductase